MLDNGLCGIDKILTILIECIIVCWKLEILKSCSCGIFIEQLLRHEFKCQKTVRNIVFKQVFECVANHIV